MFRPRVIPVLLLKGKGLIKTLGFKKERYIGDPINAVRLFNDLKADELAFLDIFATREHRHISEDLVRIIGEEANMPFAVGGGISDISVIKSLIAAGAEKVIIGEHAIVDPGFIQRASSEFGSSTIGVCIDVKKSIFGERVHIGNGRKKTKYTPVEFASLMESMGAGEIIIQSIDQDGKMNGYDVELVRKVSVAVSIPVVALGGAGSNQDIRDCYKRAHPSGLAAGSMFVFHGPRRGILVNYPMQSELNSLFS